MAEHLSEGITAKRKAQRNRKTAFSHCAKKMTPGGRLDTIQSKHKFNSDEIVTVFSVTKKD
jgi:hypothetical protein